MATRKKTTTTTVVTEESDDGPRKTLVTFLLDQTGSMQAIKSDTIGAFNAYLDRLQAEAGDLIEFSLLLFNSIATEKRHAHVKLGDVTRLSNDNFRPDGWTPLIDACVKTIKATEEALHRRSDNGARYPRVIVVFQTDGEENMSREYKRSDLADLIKEKAAAGWQFVYMGANLDAYKEASRLGIGTDSTVAYAGANSMETMQATLQNTVAFAMGASGSMAYSAKQKRAAGDNFDPGKLASVGDTPPRRPRQHRPKPIVDDINL